MNKYPTFPNPAGIGTCCGYEKQSPIIPSEPHPQVRLTPQPGQPDPVKGSGTMYDQGDIPAFNPWGVSAS